MTEPSRRIATPEDEADAWLIQQQTNAANEAREFEREKRRDRLEAEGWSDGAIRGEGDHNDGLIGAFKDSLHPWGAPDHFSDRKSKRVRKEQPRAPFWYSPERGLPEDAQGQAAAGATLVGRGESGSDRQGGQGVRVQHTVSSGAVDAQVVLETVPRSC